VRGRTSVDDRHRGHPVEFTHRGTHVNVVAVVRHHHDLRQHAVILDLRLAQLRNEHRCMHSEHRPSREANIGTGAERGSTRTGGQLFAISTSLAAETDTRQHQVSQLAAGSAVPRCGELAAGAAPGAAGSGGGAPVTGTAAARSWAAHPGSCAAPSPSSCGPARSCHSSPPARGAR
jgi:hypothetical protein